MGKIHDPKHPLWSLCRLAILMVSLVLVLWMNASHFDVTEIRTIITMFIVAASAEGATSLLSHFKR